MKDLKLIVWSGILCGFAAAMWLWQPVLAAGPAAPPTTAANDDGALFTAFVPVLRHPRCMNCHSQGDYPRQRGR